MRTPDRSATVLWALRSPCDAQCPYCYFGQFDEPTGDDNVPGRVPVRPAAPIGRLSHASPNDLPAARILEFAATLGSSRVGRVVLAGGEPLNWVPTLALIGVLREQGISVTVATNGIPLNKPKITTALLDLSVDAVSVSLDSVDPAYNDRMRPFREPSKGWDRVVSGIQTLAAARGDRPAPQIGIYSVITRENLPGLAAMAPFAASLGADYYMPQPLSLPSGHDLAAWRLTRQDAPALLQALAEAEGRGVRLPAAPYPDQFATVITTDTAEATGCFGGHDLFFVQPDGSVWDCPSSLKIAATPPGRRRSITTGPADAVFTPSGPADCGLMSHDCVCMFPLVGDRRLYEGDRQ